MDEVKRERELLEAPEHLNEKEREIWGLLMDNLECSSLEVRCFFTRPQFHCFNSLGIRLVFGVGFGEKYADGSMN